jgi:erythromycin esterase-like protein
METVRNIAAAAAALTLCAGAPSAAQVPAAAELDGALLAATAGADFVLLGESTHGTREFYLERARITEALIAEHDLGAVAIEGDWSGAERVNRYVRGLGPDASAEQALSGFTDFPAWMWRNAEFRAFVERLRTINLARPPERRVGVYGLDVYDVFDAADATLAYLDRTDPQAAARAREQYRCFAPYRRSIERYSLAVRRGTSCQAAAEAMLAEVHGVRDDSGDAEARFAAVRAASTVVGGEEYYRVQQTTGYSWNARDRRMAAAALAVRDHLARGGRPGRVAVWAHNTHVGDARETSARNRGEINLGQLLREQARPFLVGFLTHEGRVMAAEAWGERPRVFSVPPAAAGSVEAELAAKGPSRQVVITGGADASRRRPQRAIGVVYARAVERTAHYVDAALEKQFDAVVFLRETSAVQPLKGAG